MSREIRWNTFCRRRIFGTCLCLERTFYYSAIYRNKESSQTTLEAETDEVRSKDLNMQVTANKEIISIEKSTTNLDLARDRQIRRKTWKHKIRWNEQGSNLHLDAAPIALPRQDQVLNHGAIRIYKNRCFRDSDFHAGLNRQRS